MKKRKENLEKVSRWDGLADKDACYQSWWPKCNPETHMVERTNIHKLSSDFQGETGPCVLISEQYINPMPSESIVWWPASPPLTDTIGKQGQLWYATMLSFRFYHGKRQVCPQHGCLAAWPSGKPLSLPCLRLFVWKICWWQFVCSFVFGVLSQGFTL